MSIYDEINTKKSKKIRYFPDKHIPNKNESKCLRRIMSETGLSENEIRNDIKYRKILAKAHKDGVEMKRSREVKYFQNLIKAGCKETGLIPQHPETIKAIDSILKKWSNFYKPWFVNKSINAEIIVKRFAK